MDLGSFDFTRLDSTLDLKNFECTNKDLNDFLKNDAIPHQDQLFAVTYLFKLEQKIAAFFSVSNDVVSELMFEDKKTFDKFKKHMLPRPKRYKTLPAVKVGRLGVDKDFTGKGIGSDILNLIKYSFTHDNKTGCRFITIDAYNEDKTLKFYSKNEFEFFTEKDKSDKTRSMYFDLSRFIAAKPAKVEDMESRIIPASAIEL